MKTLDPETVRLFLHVLAATVWVGGQITLAALVPALRGTAEGVTAVAAERFVAEVVGQNKDHIRPFGLGGIRQIAIRSE